MREIVRSLKPDGIILHTLDMNAHHKTVLRNLKSKGLIGYPGPIVSRYGIIAFRQEILGDEFEEVLDAALGTTIATRLGEYAEDMESEYERLVTEASAGDIEQLSRQVQVSASLGGFTAELHDLNDLFVIEVRAAMHGAGLVVEQHDYIRKATIVAGGISGSPGQVAKNWLSNEKGFAVLRWDPAVPDGDLRLDVEVLVCVARCGSVRRPQ